jgi:hypothetical protein
MEDFQFAAHIIPIARKGLNSAVEKEAFYFNRDSGLLIYGNMMCFYPLRDVPHNIVTDSQLTGSSDEHAEAGLCGPQIKETKQNVVFMTSLQRRDAIAEILSGIALRVLQKQKTLPGQSPLRDKGHGERHFQ